MIVGPIFLNVCRRAGSWSIHKASIYLVLATDWIWINTVDTTHCVSIFCLPDTTYCMWQDLPGLHLSYSITGGNQNTGGSEGLRKRLRCTHRIPSSLREVCNLMKGSGLLLLSVDWLPLTPFFTFFAGSPTTVTSWPFGRPRLRRIGGVLFSAWICVCSILKKWQYAIFMIPLTC